MKIKVCDMGDMGYVPQHSAFVPHVTDLSLRQDPPALKRNIVVSLIPESQSGCGNSVEQIGGSATFFGSSCGNQNLAHPLV